MMISMDLKKYNTQLWKNKIEKRQKENPIDPRLRSKIIRDEIAKSTGQTLTDTEYSYIRAIVKKANENKT